MSDEPFSDWVRERPAVIQEMMIEWPPGAIVQSKPGVELMIPAPGTQGHVSSWFEEGLIGVESDGTPVRAQCRPEEIEVVGYSRYGETEITPDLIRQILGVSADSSDGTV